MFDKRKKLIGIAEVILSSMNHNANSYKESVLKLMKLCEEEKDEELMNKRYPEVIKEYRKRVLEDVIKHYAIEQSEVFDGESFAIKAHEAVDFDNDEFSELIKKGASPALILMTFFYTLYGKKIKYGDARPLNVEENNIMNKCLSELDN